MFSSLGECFDVRAADWVHGCMFGYSDLIFEVSYRSLVLEGTVIEIDKPKKVFETSCDAAAMTKQGLGKRKG